MRFRLRSTIYILCSLILSASYSSCDLINPEETIPSFLKIDSISLSTNPSTEGNPVQNITDAWVYENEQLVGVYELPAVVPIMKNGDAQIRIRGGIKLNGQVGSRVPFLFTNDLVSTIELFPDSQLHLNPTLTFRNDINFPWLEDFDQVGLSLAKTDFSEADVIRIEGAEAYDGKSLKMGLTAEQNIFECRTGQSFDLPGGGTPIFLEFTYRCNNSLVVGLFSRYPSGTFQIPIIVLNPSEDWNHIYVNLTDVVSSNATFLDHKPFFGFLRDDDVEGEINVYVDNIRMIY